MGLSDGKSSGDFYYLVHQVTDLQRNPKTTGANNARKTHRPEQYI
jgi:hypothetical protein